jgi:hypothetical protein
MRTRDPPTLSRQQLCAEPSKDTRTTGTASHGTTTLVCVCMADPDTRGDQTRSSNQPPAQLCCRSKPRPECSPIARHKATPQLLKCRARRRELRRLLLHANPHQIRGQGHIRLAAPCPAVRTGSRCSPVPREAPAPTGRAPRALEQTSKSPKHTSSSTGGWAPTTVTKQKDPASWKDGDSGALWVAHPKNHATCHRSVPPPVTPPTPGTRQRPVPCRRVWPAANLTAA